MRNIYLICFIAVILLSCFSCRPKDDMDIFLLIGQSNMAGRAEIREQDRDSLEMVFLFTNDPIHPWEHAANPLNKYSTIRKKITMQKLGPGYSFARTLSDHFPKQKFGLIVNAKGGTSIREWLPGTKNYQEALSRTISAMHYGTLRGILWYQGSSDTKRVEQYLAELELVINSFRADLEMENLPFIACELSNAKPERADFNRMLADLPQQVRNTAIIEAAELQTFDSTHFNSESQTIIGERYAREMIKFLEK